MIKKNAIRCKICGDVIESKSVHDFKFCSCGACAVDGGREYLRRVGDLDKWEDLSICTADELGDGWGNIEEDSSSETC